VRRTGSVVSSHAGSRSPHRATGVSTTKPQRTTSMKSQNKLALGVITSLTALGGFSLVAQQTRSPVRPVSNEITSESKRPASTSDQRRSVQRQRQGQVHDLGTVNVEVDRSQQDSRTQSATRSTSGTTATTAAASQATEPRENISVIPLREE